MPRCYDVVYHDVHFIRDARCQDVGSFIEFVSYLGIFTGPSSLFSVALPVSPEYSNTESCSLNLGNCAISEDLR